MRNELIQLSKRARLLKTNKVTCKTWKNKCKGDRKKYTISFPYVEYGTTLYGYQYPNGILLCEVPKKREAYDFTTTVKSSGKRRKDGTIQGCLNMDWFKGIAYVNIIQEKKQEYILVESNDMEVSLNTIDAKGKHLPTGTVSRCNRITLTEFHGIIYAKKAVEVEVDLDRAFMRLTPVEESSLPFAKQLQKMYGRSFAEILRKYRVQITRSVLDAHMIRIPEALAHVGHVNPGDCLPVWQDTDGSIVIEGNPITCNVTGKALHRYHDFVETLLVKEEIAQNMDAVHANAKSTKNRKWNRKLQTVDKTIKVAMEFVDTLEK